MNLIPRARRARTSIAAALALGALLLSGCSAAEDSAQATEPQEGGELVIGLQGFNHLDPQQGGNNDDVAIQRQLVASLTVSDPENPGTVLPWVAESWEISEDSSEFTFTLREDAEFHDGTPIDAQAVKANFDALLELGAQAAAASQLLEGATTTVDSEHVVTVAFPGPNLQFLEATSTTTLGLISEESTKLPIEDRRNGEYVGSGPFELESYTPEQEAVLVKVPEYNLNTEVDSNQGPAYLDRITFTQIEEISVRSGSLTSGEVQAATFLTTPELDSFEQTPGFHVIERTNPGTVFSLTPKLDKDTPLQELAVREAFQKAIDREEVSKITYGDEAIPATSLLAETTPLYTDLSGALEHDPEGAKEILEEAGWEVGADGIRERDGERLSFEVIFWQASDPLIAVQEQLAEVGIELQVVQVSVSEATAREDQSDLQYGNVSRNEPDRLRQDLAAFLPVWAEAGLDPEQNPDLPEIAEALDAQVGQQDPEERQQTLADVQTTIIEDGYRFPLYTLISRIAVSDEVHDLQLDGTSRLTFLNTWVES
ncbi:ABC transporter substrate-binding protein [Gulosibacter sp. 10]|uniref:ABC transporter substrate-binding protein n=1 Tax=Gulosibacter sp. 10 TaxID=1255570 RepID=UPI00097EA4E5|nr:ABC transporter substrate-binding protein [Gulosibacter sp. 10]SJM66421.1 ABC-type dipeptide transport system, periplasmic component [Gulosibacter sp. 10]